MWPSLRPALHARLPTFSVHVDESVGIAIANSNNMYIRRGSARFNILFCYLNVLKLLYTLAHYVDAERQWS